MKGVGESFRLDQINDRDQINWARKFCLAMGIVVIASAGCRSTPVATPIVEARDDSRLKRLAGDGREQFAEGDVESAIKNYRKAIRRAWALDEPAEIGNIAFNLAVCLFSYGENDEAKDWLIEARSELSRAGRSVGNTWLLEAKIARSEGRVADAQASIVMAECACPPCERDQDADCGDPCQTKSCGACLPCIGDEVQDKKQQSECVTAYSAQLHLAKARLANDFGDVLEASRQLHCARQAIVDSCQRDLRSEVENVAGQIHLTREEPLQAAVHFDAEADLLRAAGNLRQIPYTLQLAAEAYALARRQDLAADRLCRAARVFHGRGDQKQAWRCVTLATQAGVSVLITHPVLSQPVVSVPVVSVPVGSSSPVPHPVDDPLGTETALWNGDIIESDLIAFTGGSETVPDVTERRLVIIAREIKRALDAQTSLSE